MIGSVILKALALVLWLLAGIINLTAHRVSKWGYTFCWVGLMIYLARDVIMAILEVAG